MVLWWVAEATAVAVVVVVVVTAQKTMAMVVAPHYLEVLEQTVHFVVAVAAASLLRLKCDHHNVVVFSYETYHNPTLAWFPLRHFL